MRQQSLTLSASASIRALRKACGLLCVIAAFAGTAWAVDVPEIDPGSMAGGITLLTIGVLLVTGRRRRK
jgi:hypothetical protein